MNPTTGRLLPYLTTVLDDGSYETRADQAPQNKKRFHGKTVTGAWVALTKEINKQMVRQDCGLAKVGHCIEEGFCYRDSPMTP
jgi:hypothetical protein